MQISQDRSRARPAKDRSSSRANKEALASQHPRHTEIPKNQYFRQPRHSSIRRSSIGITRLVVSSRPSHELLPSASDVSSRDSSADIARPTLASSSRPLSSSGSGSAPSAMYHNGWLIGGKRFRTTLPCMLLSRCSPPPMTTKQMRTSAAVPTGDDSIATVIVFSPSSVHVAA